MLDLKIEKDIALLVLNRPERRNALCTEMMEQLSRQLKELDTNKSIRAVIITGAENVFCAGSDLKELAKLDINGMGQHEMFTGKVVRELESLGKPTFAAVEGYALGGGFALAIACDMVIASNAARLAMPEVANGWLPPWGLMPLKKRCNFANAQRIVWGAEHFSSKELKEMGIVDFITNEKDALSKARDLANDLTKLPMHAVTTVKKFLRTNFTTAIESDTYCNKSFIDHCHTEAAQKTFKHFFH